MSEAEFLDWKALLKRFRGGENPSSMVRFFIKRRGCEHGWKRREASRGASFYNYVVS